MAVPAIAPRRNLDSTRSETRFRLQRTQPAVLTPEPTWRDQVPRSVSRQTRIVRLKVVCCHGPARDWNFEFVFEHQASGGGQSPDHGDSVAFLPKQPGRTRVRFHRISCKTWCSGTAAVRNIALSSEPADHNCSLCNNSRNRFQEKFCSFVVNQGQKDDDAKTLASNIRYPATVR